jgi:hypothetical protein
MKSIFSSRKIYLQYLKYGIEIIVSKYDCLLLIFIEIFYFFFLLLLLLLLLLLFKV